MNTDSILALYEQLVDGIQDGRFLKTGEHRACLPKNHPLANRQSEPLAAFHAAGLEPNIRMTMHDDYSILSMVEQGLGVTILPELVLRKQSYDIVMLPTEPMVTRRISILSRERNELSIAAKTFIRCLIDHVNELP